MITYKVGCLVSTYADHRKVGVVLEVNDKETYWEDLEDKYLPYTTMVIRWADGSQEDYEIYGPPEEQGDLPIVG